ncbi:ATP-dependent zinc metalloprotease FTSH 2, chloroplastic [Cymbomonas tetramitiformis]|uniref:ATP-dependent zinc metalloprotease FTSH 2, chloroplastic n=1 Tax=Cymbomonas tetramitiformis TaxID=36881 RepID=A0AAE0GD00_9CHLO|nr:ATP-dependent zinc metalloprotease FTSH 2, chloroplastic [Cymbomonas tetramitiformis]|eukprot:gene5198-6323_t
MNTATANMISARTGVSVVPRANNTPRPVKSVSSLLKKDTSFDATFGRALVKAAAKFGRKHQSEVKAALEEAESDSSRRTLMRNAMGTALAAFPVAAANAADDPQGVASSRMSYSRFLEYLDMDRVKKVDLYENGTIAIVEAVSPELGNRVQRVRVQLPGTSQELLAKFREKNIDFAAHSNSEDGGAVLMNLLGNLAFPLLLVGGLFLLSRRQQGGGGMGGGPGGPGNPMAFGKSKARFQMEPNTGVKFDDVAGVDEAKEDFMEVVEFLKKPEKFTVVGARIPKGVLLVGPPGTGKTLLAKAIAGEAGVPFFSISGSEFVEMFVGVGASRVRDLFKKAKENAPCIVFVDEIDAVGRSRGTGVGGGNDEREQTLNQLLTEMDGFEGNTGIIVVAATNRADILDSALLRPGRFDRQVSVDVPDLKGRIEILKVHARNKKFDDDVDLETMALRTPGFSGADLSNLLNEAAILTGRRNKEVISLKEVDDSVDRIVAGMEGTAMTDGKSKNLVAYHEVGHAICGSLTPGHDAVQKVTLIPRGQAKGLTWFIPGDDPTLISKSQLQARVVGALGGRAAEEVVFGRAEVTTGASGDLQQVAGMAKQMVTAFGMSEIGPWSLEDPSAQGGDMIMRMMARNSMSEKLASDIDDAVQKIANDGYAVALKQISDNREAMDAIVEELVVVETMTGDRFREILSQYTEIPECNIPAPLNPANSAAAQSA